MELNEMLANENTVNLKYLLIKWLDMNGMKLPKSYEIEKQILFILLWGHIDNK